MKKTMKRRAFISAIAMLIVSAIVLTSSTFAWFSMTKEVNVETMNLNITTAKGISISANVKKFGTTLSSADFVPATEDEGKNLAAENGHANSIPELLSPVSTDMHIVNGYPVFYKGSIGEDKKIKLDKVTNEKEGGFVVFDIFVQVSEDNTTVKLYGSSVTSEDANIVKAMRLGIVNCGYKAFEKKAEAKTIAGANDTATSLWIVDGNSEDRTGYIPYDMVTGSGTTASINTTTSNPYIGSDFTVGTRVSAANVCKAADASGLTFKAMAGVNRIRFYLWVEGNDPDCTNDIAGGNFDFNLKLSID